MADVVVVGGGIVGAAAAYRLACAGARVTLVDRGDRGQATAAGAGILAPGTSLRPPAAFYPLAYRAVAYYPELVAALAAEGEADTGYETVGLLFVAVTAAEAERLAEVRRTFAERAAAGVTHMGAVRCLAPGEARELFPPLGEVAAAVHVAGAARVDGRRLRDALCRAALRRGARLLADSARLVRRGARVDVVLAAAGERLAPAAVIIAGGAWSAEVAAVLDLSLPVAPQRGQIVHLELPQAHTGRWPVVLGFHSHYLLAFPPNRVVAGATRETGVGFDARVTAGGTHEVLGEALRVAPGLAAAGVAEWRVGLRPASADGLPVLGRVPTVENVWIATGHGASGLQLGPYSGAAVAELALGRRPDFDLGPYGPDRFLAPA